MTGEAVQIDETCGGLLPFMDEQDRAATEGVSGSITGWLNRGELRSRALEFAALTRSPKKGLAILRAANGVSNLVALLGLRAAGHAVALIDPATPKDRWIAILNAYRPNYVVGPAGELSAEVAWRLQSFQDFQLAERERREPGDIDPDTAVLLSTSGTTGSAKLVRLSGRAIVTNASQIAEALHIEPSDVGVAHLPIHYSYGLSVVTSHLAVGASVVLMNDAITTPTFWKTIDHAGGTHFPGVPFHYTVLARLGLKRLAPPSLRTFTQAGGGLAATVQQAIHRQAAERNAEFYVMYGQTEAAPRMATLPSKVLPARIGSVGVALRGGRLTVVNSLGCELPPGAVGEVVYEGPNVMQGYAVCREDLSRGDRLGGRLVTGDLGRLDEDGYLYLSGRSKRFAKVYGLRISLDEIEGFFGPDVAALDHDETILLFHDAVDAPVISERIAEVASQSRLPSAVFIARPVVKLPRKHSGKVDYAAIRELV